jgi:hypothetical protein
MCAHTALLTLLWSEATRTVGTCAPRKLLFFLRQCEATTVLKAGVTMLHIPRGGGC